MDNITREVLEHRNITIPTDLNMSTADRLRLVADLIEAMPGKWDQGDFTSTEFSELIDSTGPVGNAGHLAEAIDMRCGTVGCLAGWAVVCSPRTLIEQATQGNWSGAGATAFGLDDELAYALFLDWYSWGLDDEDGPGPFAAALRSLADLPEPRTLEAALRAGILTEQDPDDDE